ncbi:HpaII family restriction endonuclease [Flavobacterium ginsengisoli]|uniref:HpaII family restriction endonuclease n=1 Tax=Flavobacterium ginsengisoli TaxID=871694 RepID=A0ABP7EV68_9FLAO|nr:HpaII family restriction endonuclease [Flavobacterium ginsengisoli]
MIKGNKGEWSELYVLTKLLADGKLFQSDLNLNKDENNYYEITKVYKEESTSMLEFDRDTEVNLYQITNNKRTFLKKLTVDYFTNNCPVILNGIIQGKGKSFSIESSNDFLNEIEVNKLTALSTSKSDIKLRIYDYRLAKETDLGFSIKSLLGEDSTLFNTGVGNNFIFEIENNLGISLDDFNGQTYKPLGRISKITARLKKIIDSGLEIKFKEIQSKQLWRNLKMIDGDLPEILAYALFYRWINRDSSLTNVANMLEMNDPLNFYDGEKSNQKLYEYKLKRFLAECAMGMTSETPWHGVYDATGGVIIPKKDGDIVCFHIYDFNLFREYLIKNTIFEQPSTGEDEKKPGYPRTRKGTKKYYYGWLYEETDKLYFKINLQIRFK